VTPETNSDNRANTVCGGWAILLLSLAGSLFDFVISLSITGLAHPINHDIFVPVWIFLPSIVMAIIAGKYLKIAGGFKSSWFMIGLGSISILISILGLVLLVPPSLNSKTHITLFKFNKTPAAPSI
jgi:hypothetical protein